MVSPRQSSPVPVRKFFEELHTAVAWADVVHLHGVFSPWNLFVARVCRKFKKPYVVTLHDGLSPERLRLRGRFRKKLFHSLIQRRHLEAAAGVHALTEEEATEALPWFRPRRMFCVPNGIDLEDFPATLPRVGDARTEVVLGYVGRLSPEKNIGALCRAVYSLAETPCASGSRGPRLGLRAATADDICGIRNRLDGPKYASEKIGVPPIHRHVRHAFSVRGFSIAAIEVLAVGTPMLITRTSKMELLFRQRRLLHVRTDGLRHRARDRGRAE